jgi:hypothetical protein
MTRFDRWLFREYAVSARDLAVFRVIFSVTALALFLPRVRMLDALPDTFYHPPPGPLSLPTRFPPDGVTLGLELVLAVGLVALLFGYRTTLASVVVSLAWLYGEGLLHSTAKVSHGVLLFSILPLFLAAAGWGRAWSVDAWLRPRDAEPRRWPMALLALAIGGMFVTAAIPKIQAGWLDPSTQAVHRSILARADGPYLAGHAAAFDSRALWELVDLATIALEAGLVLTVVRLRWFRIALSTAVLFHVGVVVTLDIRFLAQVVAYGAFVPWGAWAAWLLARRRLSLPIPRSTRLTGVAAAVAVVVVGLGLHALSDLVQPTQGLLPGLGDLRAWLIFAAGGFAAGHLLHEIGTTMRRRSSAAVPVTTAADGA